MTENRFPENRSPSETVCVASLIAKPAPVIATGRTNEKSGTTPGRIDRMHERPGCHDFLCRHDDRSQIVKAFVLAIFGNNRPLQPINPTFVAWRCDSMLNCNCIRD